MSRLSFGVVLVAAAVAGGAGFAAEPAKRPNILFIFSDDHAQHAISAYGSQVNKTPHLDRLAAAGARVTNSFVTHSICTPSRATLLTGQYSHKNGVPVACSRVRATVPTSPAIWVSSFWKHDLPTSRFFHAAPEGGSSPLGPG